MPARKAKLAKAPASQPVPHSKDVSLQLEARFFPLARYTSIVGVHASLLVFTVLFVPQTSYLFIDLEVKVTDRPQHILLEALTANPVLTLAWICAGVAVLQGWWGGWMRHWCFEYSFEGTEIEKTFQRQEFNKQRLSKYGEAFLFTLFVSLLFHIIIVLFGAPIFSYSLHTYLLACIVSFLTVFTPTLTLGYPSLGPDTKALINRLTWIRLFAELSPRNPMERAMVYPAVGSMLGCWSGAIPIALDWDRPWQAWPLTPLFGGIMGHILGSFLALAVSLVQWLAQEHINSQKPPKEKTI